MKRFNRQDTKNILKLLNSEAGRFLLGIKHNLPIVRFDTDWIEMWSGEFDKKGNPILKATVWIDNHVEKSLMPAIEKMDIMRNDYSRQKITNFYEAFLHFSGLEPNFRKFPSIFFLTATKNPNTGDGHITVNSDGTWGGARDRASGDSTDTTKGANSSSRTVTPVFIIRRWFLPFNTSDIGQIASVTAADIQVYRDDTISAFVNDNSTSLEIVPSTQASATALALADYSKVTFTSRGTKTFATTTNAAYNLITITNFTEITGTANTFYAIITGLDLSNTAPTGTQTNDIFFQNRGGANPPKLDLTYTLVGVNPAYAFIM